MGAVQHPELHQLEGGDVLDQLRPDGAEVGPDAVDEGVLHHPLAEGLVHHRREVEPAGEAGEARHVLGLRRRDDAVDHGAGKGPLGGDPRGEARVDQSGELQRHAADHPAVFRQVVAGEHGEGPQACGPPPLQRPDEEAEGGARRAPLQVGEDVGMRPVQPAGGGLVAIAFFRHGQADDPHPGIGHGGQDRLRILAGDQHALDRLDDPRRLAPRPQFERGVGAALGGEQVALARGDEAHPQHAPVAPRGRHGLGDVDRPMGAEEGPEAEVDDPHPRARRGGAGQTGEGEGLFHRQPQREVCGRPARRAAKGAPRRANTCVIGINILK